MNPGQNRAPLQDTEASLSQTKADSELVHLVHLLARQAARELAEQPPEDNEPKPSLSEDRS
jgi:hypothetical protein